MGTVKIPGEDTAHEQQWDLCDVGFFVLVSFRFFCLFCFLILFLFFASNRCSAPVRNYRATMTFYPGDLNLIFMSCGHSSKEQRDFLRENIR